MTGGKILTVSSLEKVFPDTVPTMPENGHRIFSNEIFHFQACVLPSGNSIMLRIDIESDIKDCISVRIVKSVPAGYAKSPYVDDYILEGRGNNQLYPDILRPYRKDGEIFVGGSWSSVFISVDGRKNRLPEGNHVIKIRVYNTYDKTLWDPLDLSCEYSLTVLKGTVPDSDLVFTHWLHYDCICDKHNARSCNLPVRGKQGR